jgi:hypothetical protein
MMKFKRSTPDVITKIEANEVFVFGSNESGRHGKVLRNCIRLGGAVWDKLKVYKVRLMEFLQKILLFVEH